VEDMVESVEITIKSVREVDGKRVDSTRTFSLDPAQFSINMHQQIDTSTGEPVKVGKAMVIAYGPMLGRR
jgi:hypothetical protein